MAKWDSQRGGKTKGTPISHEAEPALHEAKPTDDATPVADEGKTTAAEEATFFQPGGGGRRRRGEEVRQKL
jgi:hypothetical protein